jgi:Rrf2 family transcriptional regulator, nitric oxide-sensitive transcriptional repressor
MRLTTRTNLAMRTLMFCAANPGRIVRKSEVATACNASENHLAQVIHLLARAGPCRWPYAGPCAGNHHHRRGVSGV